MKKRVKKISNKKSIQKKIDVIFFRDWI